MSKKEVINEIVYDLKMSGNVDFEVDDESYSVDSLQNGGYVIRSICRYIEVKNLTDFRKEVSKLGSKLLLL
jgi:hypothetical protein